MFNLVLELGLGFVLSSETASADIDLLGVAVVIDGSPVNIGRPTVSSVSIGEADSIARLSGLEADFTSSHNLPLTRVVSLGKLFAWNEWCCTTSFHLTMSILYSKACKLHYSKLWHLVLTVNNSLVCDDKK